MLKLSKFLIIILFATSFVTTGSFTNIKSTQTLAQVRVSDFLSLWKRKSERKVARTSRSIGVCAISPGIFETYQVWNDRPLFLWKSSAKQDAELVIREYDNQTEVWRKPVNIADEKLLYSGEKPLEAGKLYQWQLFNKTKGINESVTFQIMPASERGKIQSDLEALEKSSLVKKASPEETALSKANYFLEYKIQNKNDDVTHLPWSDVLQSLYEVKNPSTSFVEQREKFVVSMCTINSTASNQK